MLFMGETPNRKQIPPVLHGLLHYVVHCTEEIDYCRTPSLKYRSLIHNYRYRVLGTCTVEPGTRMTTNNLPQDYK